METMTIEEYRRLHGKRAPTVKPRPGIKLPREDAGAGDLSDAAWEAQREPWTLQGWWFATARLREALKLAETDLEAERILNLSDEEVLAGVDVKQQAAEMKVIVDDAVAWSNYYRRVEAAARWYCALNGTERYNRLVEVLNSVPGETK